MTAMQPVRASHPAPRSRPDARPMRMALGAGGIAAFSALAAAIVLPPHYAPAATQQQATDQAPSPTPIQVVRPIQYVQLAPGQTAPPGATVIDASAPTPITVVVTVPAPTQKVAAQTPTIIKTTQSGKVIP